MATEKFANDIQTTISAELTEGATTVKVESATGFPSSAQYRIRIDSEILIVTGGAGTKEWTVTRGAEETAAAPHVKSSVAAHVLTAQGLTNAFASAANIDRDLGQAGIWAPSGPGGNSATGLLTANRALFCRFIPSRAMTITKIAFVVNTAALSNDNCDVGIYASDGSTLLKSSGSTAGKLNVIGPQSVSLSASQALTAGTIYYAAFAYGAVGSTAGQLVGPWNSAITSVDSIFGETAPTRIAAFMNTNFPLATGATFSASAPIVPWLAVRES